MQVERGRDVIVIAVVVFQRKRGREREGEGQRERERARGERGESGKDLSEVERWRETGRG